MTRPAGARGQLTVSCASVEATQGLAARIARRATPGTVLALSGDLGAGKTAFIQGLAAGLGIEGPVTSPTFIMVAEHAEPLLPPRTIRVRIRGAGDEPRTVELDDVPGSWLEPDSSRDPRSSR